MVTDKTKVAFRNWYSESYLKKYYNRYGIDIDLNLNIFYDLPLSMQIGVHQLFFDSVGIDISIDTYYLHKAFGFNVVTEFEYIAEEGTIQSRQEAWIKAIEQADKIYNENN